MTGQTSQPKVALIQDGARLHYAVAIALHRAGILQSMYSEWFDRPRSIERAITRCAKLLRHPIADAMAGRTCDAINNVNIHTNPRLALRQRRARDRYRCATDFYRWSARQVTDWVRRVGFGQANALHGYIRNIDPALLEAARQQGMTTVADQIIAPAAVEIEEARKQNHRFGRWQTQHEEAQLVAYQQWEADTWPLLDRITCGSDYVRDGLIAQGVEAGRIDVLPYPFDTDAVAPVDRRARGGPITVGFVGIVNLRKRAPYCLQVAAKLKAKNLRFVMVGDIGVAPNALAAHQGDVEMTGRVHRAQVIDQLSRFDVLLFPSTCEGSAGAVMEAMATGLPVVASPNSGSVVRDGKEGFICPYDDIDALADRIEQLAVDNALRASMGQAARQRAEQFNLNWYSRQLTNVYARAMQRDARGNTTTQPQQRNRQTVQ
jgi:glycosyltransferase involved in cell wall biosynthesis